MLTFAELRMRWPWKPIRNCPGRYVLDRDHSHLSLSMLLDSPAHSNIFHSAAAQDPIHVVRLEDGGIISYAHPDGRMVHTLNTPEGFSRKLQQLGLEVEEGDRL